MRPVAEESIKGKQFGFANVLVLPKSKILPGGFVHKCWVAILSLLNSLHFFNAVFPAASEARREMPYSL